MSNTLMLDRMSEHKIHILRFRVQVDYASILDNVNFDDALEVLTKTIEEDRKAINTRIAAKPSDFINNVIMSKAESYGHDGGIDHELEVYGLETDKEYKERMLIVRAEQIRLEALAEKNRIAKDVKTASRLKKVLKETEDRRKLYLELQKEFGNDSGPGA